MLLLQCLQIGWLLVMSENNDLSAMFTFEPQCHCLCLQLRSIFVSDVLFFSASLNAFTPASPILPPVNEFSHQKVITNLLCVWDEITNCFNLLHRLSSVSDVFSFNPSLSAVAPMSPMLLTVYLLCIESHSEVFMFSSLPLKFNSVSVAFDFNASLSSTVPADDSLFSVNHSNDVISVLHNVCS